MVGEFLLGMQGSAQLRVSYIKTNKQKHLKMIEFLALQRFEFSFPGPCSLLWGPCQTHHLR